MLFWLDSGGAAAGVPDPRYLGHKDEPQEEVEGELRPVESEAARL